MPGFVTGTPEKPEDHRLVSVFRDKNVIAAIDILIANDLDDLSAPSVPSDGDGCNVLKYISSQNCLDYYQIDSPSGSIGHPEIVNITIPVQIQVRDLNLRVIQPIFKIS